MQWDAMDEGAQRWLYKTARANYWRVSSWIDLDDLIQDGYWHFCRLVNKYPDVTRPHLMTLFKRTFTNHLHDLAKQRTRAPAELLACDLVGKLNSDDYSALWERISVTQSDQEVRDLIASANSYVKLVLSVLLSDEKCTAFRRLSKPRRNGTRETTNEKLRRILDLPKGAKVDLMGEVRAFLAQPS